MIGVVGRICGTTWKSNWRRRHSAQKRRLRLRSLMPATNATAAAPYRVRAKQLVRHAVGADKGSVRVGSCRSRKHVLAGMSPVKSSKHHVRNAAAKAVSKS